jgi:glycosyltransferase involved in cell wall biosynthesis
MEEPLISIITVVFNREKTLEKALRSVVNQTYKNVEYIVIDGASTDGTLDVIKKYRNKIDVFESKKDKGMYYALNRGVELATGDLIGICHSDDWLYDEHVIEKVAKVHEAINADVYYGSMYSFHNNTLSEELAPTEELEQNLKRFFHPATFIRKAAFEGLGGYNTKYRSASDYELLLRLKLNQYKFHQLHFPVCVMTVGTDDRVSHNCYAHKEAFDIHKRHQTGNHLKYVYSYYKCRMIKFAKKILRRG